MVADGPPSEASEKFGGVPQAMSARVVGHTHRVADDGPQRPRFRTSRREAEKKVQLQAQRRPPETERLRSKLGHVPTAGVVLDAVGSVTAKNAPTNVLETTRGTPAVKCRT